MKRFLLALMLVPIQAFPQYNCNIFKMNNNQPCYEACLAATEAEPGQGTRSSGDWLNFSTFKPATFGYGGQTAASKAGHIANTNVAGKPPGSVDSDLEID